MRAVVEANGTRTIYGTSSETKPTGTVNGQFDVEAGDVFYEVDTTDVYMWSGSAWVKQ